jgi:hypothetical protein
MADFGISVVVPSGSVTREESLVCYYFRQLISDIFIYKSAGPCCD